MERFTLTSIFVGFALLVVLISYAASTSTAERRAAIEMRCTPIRHTASQAVIVATGRSIGVGAILDTTCYRCPDGVEECF